MAESPIFHADGRLRLPELMIRMRCDGAAGCKELVEWAPCVWVPSRTPQAPGHEWLRMQTTLHCCGMHRGFVTREGFIDDRIKALFEDAARKKRPLDFRCEFDNAMVDYVQIRSEEYQAFLRSPRGVAVLQLAAARPSSSLILHG